jgi:iron(III) transport system ATP-binding protein
MHKVDIEHVSLSYGETAVLKDVNISIPAGQFFALLGPSGSGKSTLLRLIAGFNQAQAGRVVIGGVDITRVPPWQRDVGMVFQNYALWPHMTVAENVAFGLEERKLPRQQIREKVAAVLDLVGLQGYDARRPSQLSGGQQQRVALARTLAIEPKVLLLDEPLSNLDAKLRVHMRAELRALQRKLGITTIFVTHDQEEAMTTADYIAVLDHGVVQQTGEPVELYDRPANRFVAGFVGTINLLRGVVVVDGDRSVFHGDALGNIPLPDGAAASAGPAEIAIRPHTIVLAAPGAPNERARAWFDGAVTEREFLGEFMRYRVKVAEEDLTVDQPHYRGEPGFPVSARVRVGLNPEQIKVLGS